MPNDEGHTTNFEVESIELATPELFSQDEEYNSSINQNTETEEIRTFNKMDSTENTILSENEKEPEMFNDPDLEEDFEIPAFLRRQKN